jgi:hypothetical protein
MSMFNMIFGQNPGAMNMQPGNMGAMPLQPPMQGVMPMPQPQPAPVASEPQNPMANMGQRLRGNLGPLLQGLGMALASGNPGMGAQYMAQMGQQRQEMAQKAQTQNRTLQWLKSQGRDDLAQAVEAGLLPAGDAVKMVYSGMEGAKPTDDIREFEYARQQGFDGSFNDWMQAKRPQNNVNVNTAEGGDAKFLGELNKGTAQNWNTLQVQGTKAAGILNDMDMLEELARSAPQGPLVGRLAETFRGFNSAGDAFNSVVKRLTPQMRVEGSGSTSDMEMRTFQDSLPSLKSTPGTNAAIMSMFRAKAQIDVERAGVVSAVQNGELSVSEGRRRMEELNKRSIMTPELKAQLGFVSGGDNASAPEGVDPKAWQYMTPEERALWQR